MAQANGPAPAAARTVGQIADATPRLARIWARVGKMSHPPSSAIPGTAQELGVC